MDFPRAPPKSAPRVFHSLPYLLRPQVPSQSLPLTVVTPVQGLRVRGGGRSTGRQGSGGAALSSTFGGRRPPGLLPSALEYCLPVSRKNPHLPPSSFWSRFPLFPRWVGPLRSCFRHSPHLARLSYLSLDLAPAVATPRGCDLPFQACAALVPTRLPSGRTGRSAPRARWRRRKGAFAWGGVGWAGAPSVGRGDLLNGRRGFGPPRRRTTRPLVQTRPPSRPRPRPRLCGSSPPLRPYAPPGPARGPQRASHPKALPAPRGGPEISAE